jgi:uncharacterized damage-inducible protein DinB
MEQIERLFEHMFWADTRLLEQFDGQSEAPQPDALRLFAHVLAAERTWLLRLRGENSRAQQVWPEPGLEGLHALAASNAEGYGQFLVELAGGELDVDIVYANSQGVPFRNRVSDILLHVALHGSYHRGQIAMALRTAGHEPVNTDFITFARLPSE